MLRPACEARTNFIIESDTGFTTPYRDHSFRMMAGLRNKWLATKVMILNVERQDKHWRDEIESTSHAISWNRPRFSEKSCNTIFSGNYLSL